MDSNNITSHLELNTIAVLSYIQWAERVHDDCFYEGLDPVIKITCGCVSVLPNKFMSGGVRG